MKTINFDLIFCPVNQVCPNGPPYRVIFVERDRHGEQGYLDFNSRSDLDEALEKIGILHPTVESGIVMMETGRVFNILNVPVPEARARKMGVVKRKQLHFPTSITA